MMKLVGALLTLTLYSFNNRDVVVGHVIPNNNGSEVVLTIDGNKLELHRDNGNGSSWLQMVLVFAPHSSNSQPQIVIPDKTCNNSEKDTTEAPIVCKEGFVQLESKKCYFFSTTIENWQNALESCQAMGTTLAYPLNESENTVLVDYVKKDFEGIASWWLGATDDVKEGQFVWAHSKSPIGYGDWASGQPDDYAGNEDCLHIYKPFGWKWNDVPCKILYNYICQQ